jgi:diguanylate cyclase
MAQVSPLDYAPAQVSRITISFIMDARNPLETSLLGTTGNLWQWLAPSDEPRQVLRIQRFFMAFMMYVLCFLVAWVCNAFGLIEWRAIMYALVPALAVNLLLYWMFRSGINRAFEDPSLTLIQTVAATSIVMYAVYVSDSARILFIMLYPIPFMFGALRLSAIEHGLLAAYALVAYGLAIGLAWQWKPLTIDLRQEMLQWATLAIELGWMIALGHALKTMRRRAAFDQLTGVPNRHSILDSLEREEQRCHRGGPPFCVCMLDIDHLKRVNDSFGHSAGDFLLKRFAQTILKELRTVDYFGRYGGDEFLLILTNTECEQAKPTVERIRAALAGHSIDDIAPGMRLSMSVGIAQFSPDESVARTITRADLALYQAKRAGRDRIAWAAGANDHGPSAVAVR